jgi:hypothetical protein
VSETPQEKFRNAGALHDIYYTVDGKMRGPWMVHQGMSIDLLTPEEYESLPDGTLLFTVVGWNHVKGEDNIDLENTTHGPFLSVGLNRADVLTGPEGQLAPPADSLPEQPGPAE